MRRRWLFGDQLGPHFLDSAAQPVLLIESSQVFRRRAFHRQKAHLILSAMRHRAAEKRLLLEDFYRDARQRLDVLMEGDQPVTGQWNYDADNREPPPRGRSRLPVAAPWWPTEDEIDAEDAILDDDRWMSHSLLSAPLNLGLLDPLEVVRAAEDAYAEGHARSPRWRGPSGR